MSSGEGKDFGVENTCLKCGYVRDPTDLGPEGECPRCGVIYSKVEAVRARDLSDTDDGTVSDEKEKVDEPVETGTLSSLIVHIREEIIEGCRGRLWHGRALLLVFFVYIGVRYVFDVTYHSLFDGLNLIIHEGGHLLFGYGGEFIGFAGGTFLQLITPVGSAVMFARQRDYFAISACGVWFSTNLYGVATYMADARDMVLPLVTVGGGDAMHDWYYLFSKLGLLRFDKAIATLVRINAFLVMWVFIALGAWMVWIMYSSRGKKVF